MHNNIKAAESGNIDLASPDSDAVSTNWKNKKGREGKRRGGRIEGFENTIICVFSFKQFYRFTSSYCDSF